jgi:hypothetical protein
MSLGIHSRFSCAKQIDSVSSGEPFPWHRNSSPGRIRHEEKSECMHRWTRWTFQTLNIRFVLFFNFNVIYFLTNIICVRNGFRDFSITLYDSYTTVRALTRTGQHPMKPWVNQPMLTYTFMYCSSVNIGGIWLRIPHMPGKVLDTTTAQ